MNEILCDHDEVDATVQKTSQNTGNVKTAETPNPYWKVPLTSTFAAKYTVQLTKKELEKRRNQAKIYAQSPGIEWSIRMIWGNTQEATSLLIVLNYFWKQDSRIVLKEVGMCGAGLALNQTAAEISMGLLVGATPDALLVHPDGTTEAVEVKNLCPFQPNYASQKTSRGGTKRPRRQCSTGRVRVGQQKLTQGVMPQYIPQLMMEMLCVGPACKSAIMVRQTDFSGALILRILRDDEWIEEMIYWLNHFYEDFVKLGNPPPVNFFYESDNDVEQERYMNFLKRTLELNSKVELVSHVPHHQIQRAT